MCEGILSVEDRMFAAALLSLSLQGAAASPSVAVADLSSSPQPAVAEALRKGPGMKGRVQAAAQSAAVIEDARGLGIDCKLSDDPCLEKLLVLFRTDELVAFSLERGSLRLARVVSGRPVSRAKVRFIAPSSSAREGLLALNDERDDDADRPQLEPAPKSDEKPNEPLTPVAPARPEKETPQTFAEQGTGADGSFSPMLVVGVIGGIVTVGCGAAALGTSAHLAALEEGGDLNGTDYEGTETAFYALLICSGAGAIATGVSLGLSTLEESNVTTEASE